jgi:hypothetical protein
MSSAAPAGTSRRWSLPRWAANWTARKSTWRSGTSARNGARYYRAEDIDKARVAITALEIDYGAK